ncbi:MAG: lysylphosphatidylglycerol synthase transmembrane domain-containing protein [Bacillota bacterium]|nr:lysylphosphatidylglycerol synthase transmembrane domain-containing protein [Bacillota bacterium]
MPGQPQLPRLVRGVAGALFFGVAGGLLVLGLARGGSSLRTLVEVKPACIGAAAVLVIAGWFLDAFRLQVMARPLGARLGLGQALRITLMATFVSGVTPFDSGGEPLAIYLLAQSGIRLGESTAVIAVKSLLSAAVRLLLAIVLPLLLFLARRTWVLPTGVNLFLSAGLIVYVAALTALAFLAAKPLLVEAVSQRLLQSRLASRLLSERLRLRLGERLRHGAADFRESVALLYREKRSAVVVAAFLTLLVWAVTFLVPVMVLRGLGMDPPWAEVLAVAAVFYLVAAYAPTPGSSGAAETSSALLFARLVPLKFLGLFVLVWRLVAYYLGLAIGGVMLLLHLRNSRRPDRKGYRGEEAGDD